AGAVSFDEAPAEGAKLAFAFVAVGDPVLAYPLKTSDGRAPIDLEAVDAAGEPVSVTWADGVLTVDVASFVEDELVAVSYANLGRQRFSVTLPAEPLPGSVSARGGDETCTTAPQLVVDGPVVTVDGCGFADDVASVVISYR